MEALATPRVLDAEPVPTLVRWIDAGGGGALAAARAAGADAVVQAVEDSGLRGRGGGGFPTGTKWRTIVGFASAAIPATVVVNGAEGEPGSFKDRAILLANPYRVLEGALVAAFVVGADRVVVALKATAPEVVERVRTAVDEVVAEGWADGVALEILEGPDAYLYGEETALREVVEGREPFPRIAPPWRRGAEDVGDVRASAAGVELAAPTADDPAPPALVDNVETLANVAGIVVQGPDWFRSVGTAASPGTLVVTVSGRTSIHGVAEVPMGTTIREAIDLVGDGPITGRVVAVMPGVSGPVIPGDRLDTPLTYEAFRALGSGLGAGTLIVLDEDVDPVAVAHGASRFLAVESCGQCLPCKLDGRVISEILDRLRRSVPEPTDEMDLLDRLRTITDGARCALADQHQELVRSFLERFPDEVAAHAAGTTPPADEVLIAEVRDLRGGRVFLDEDHARKQTDWTYGDEDSGRIPAQHLDQASGEALRDPSSPVTAR